MTNSLHGVRFYRHFFGFIFITLVVAFDTVDRSLSLKILPSPRFCETHPPRLFLLPLWPFLSQVPSLVPLLLLHSQHQGFFVLFCFSWALFSVLFFFPRISHRALNAIYTLMTLTCTSLASNFFIELQANIFIVYLTHSEILEHSPSQEMTPTPLYLQSTGLACWIYLQSISHWFLTQGFEQRSLFWEISSWGVWKSCSVFIYVLELERQNQERWMWSRCVHLEFKACEYKVWETSLERSESCSGHYPWPILPPSFIQSIFPTNSHTKPPVCARPIQTPGSWGPQMQNQGDIAPAQMVLQVEEIDIHTHRKMPYFFVFMILSIVRKFFITGIHGL